MTPNRIDQLFDRCRRENRAALIPYVTGGYPNLETTSRILLGLEKAGADAIELGVPFSDPIADGPTIQKASVRALAAGASVKRILGVLKESRRAGLQAPVILFGAYNPFLHYGLEAIARDASEAGVDGFLAADLPVEESGEFKSVLDKAGLHLIYLVAPTTPDPRLREIADHSTGFLYCIALKGVTGARTSLDSSVGPYLERVRAAAHHRIPLALGFGISRPDQVRSLRGQVDAVVVGSALVSTIGTAADAGEDPAEAASRFIGSLAEALHAPAS